MFDFVEFIEFMLKKIFYSFAFVLLIVCLISAFIAKHALNDWQQINVKRDNDSSVTSFIYGYESSREAIIVTTLQLASLINFEGVFENDTTELLSELTNIMTINDHK